MESYENKTESYGEKVNRHAWDVYKEIQDGNLILPQMYSAIRVYGASAILDAAIEDVSMEDLEDTVAELLPELAEKFLETMRSAHKPFGIDVEKIGVTERGQSAMLKQLEGLFTKHFEVAITTAADVMEQVEASSLGNLSVLEQNKFARECLEDIKKVLLSSKMREEIIDYRRHAASKKTDNYTNAAAIQEKWFRAYIDSANFSPPPFLTDDTEMQRLFFNLVTDYDSTTLDEREEG